MKRSLSFILAVLFSAVLFSQVPVGSWDTHFSYTNTTQVLATPNKYFAVSSNKLFSVMKDDRSMDLYTEVDGLSGNSVQLIAYSSFNACLVVAYTDANIDIIDEDGVVYNIPYLKDKQLNVDKTVNNIYFIEDKAYLASGFGILTLNLSRVEIADTYVIGENASMIPVYAINSDGTYLQALTEEGIKTALLQGVNLLDFQNWQDDIIALPSENVCTDMCSFNGDLIVAEDKGMIYRMVAGTWQVLNENSFHQEVNLKELDASLLLCLNDAGLISYNAAFEPYTYDIVARDACYDPLNLAFWVASGSEGLVELSAGVQTKYFPNGPLYYSSYDFCYSEGRMFTALGGAWTDRLSIQGMLPQYSNNIWTTFPSSIKAEVSDRLDYYMDVMSIVVDPRDSQHMYFSTWGEGVFELRDGEIIEWYTADNTSAVIQSASPDSPFENHYIRMSGLCYDNDDNLWMLNSSVSNGLKVLMAEGEWKSFSYTELMNKSMLSKMIISNKGYKWVVSTRGTAGVFVVDDNDTFDVISDDNKRFFSSFTDKDGNIITPSLVYDVEEDKDGAVWIATDQGPIVMNNTSSVFDSDYRCTRIKIARNDGSGLADYLLDGEPILDIAIDGGNRKWIATSNSGVYLLSPDGKTTIQHFTKDNSPLSSNQISAIGINEETGEVFIGAEEGVLSYRSDATEPVNEFDKATIYAFPNPVRPGYTGLLTVAGLEENTLVKITDTSGMLVFEGTSNGGSISWDTKNYSGSYVSSGVYYVLCTNSSEFDNRSIATKVLIVR